MVFHWIAGIWQCSGTYRGEQFNIEVVKHPSTSVIFAANVKIGDKQIRLSILPDSDFNNVGKDASVAVRHYIDRRI